MNPIEYKFYKLPEGDIAACECCGDDSIPTALFGNDFLELRDGAPPKKLICELCANSLSTRDPVLQSVALMLNVVRRDLRVFKDTKTVPHPGRETAL